ncbi:MAG: hypothetical protein IJW37_03650 [Lachnospiraceae bacterium]|nr:hypothetical protein [Lachnospiraceae bacterium]
MNKIKLIANRETNYVYHMLSVAKCGYDNDYGRKYRGLYAEEDLQVLKAHESMLTIVQDKHCGELCGLIVGAPSVTEGTAKEYYESLLTMIAEDTVPEEQKKHIPAVEAIARVMIKYYDSYVESIWPKEKEELEAYLPQVQAVFDENHFTEQAENIVGCELPMERFVATMVTSVQNGAEAIIINGELDLLGIVRPVRDTVFFIAHEFIVFLLLGEFTRLGLEPEEGWWEPTEGLAEYYMKQTIGETGFFNEVEAYVRFYEEQVKQGPKTAVELYNAAMAWKR